MIELLILLFFGHALADGAFQHRAMSSGKFRYVLNKDGEYVYNNAWWHWLTSHSLVHCGFVYIFTLNPYLAIAEFVIHWITDFLKTEGKIGRKMDQIIHCGCKLLWAGIIIYG